MDVRCRSRLSIAGALVLAVLMIVMLAVLAAPAGVYAEAGKSGRQSTQKTKQSDKQLEMQAVQEQIDEILELREEKDEAAANAEGDEDEDPEPKADPIQIGSYMQLYSFIKGINDGSIDPAQDAVLTSDIVVPAALKNGWVPLAADQEHAYQGIFDGADHTIKGINIDRSNLYPDTWTEGVKVGSYTAFISFLGEDGEVRNLHLEADITDVNCVGGIVSQNAGFISNCDFKGSLVSNIYPNEGSEPSYCYPDGIFDDASAESGGIAAVNMGLIYDCNTLEGTTIYHGGVHCGGIVGSQIEGGIIIGSDNYADVTVGETAYPVLGTFVGGAGGIAGSQHFTYLYGQEETVNGLLMLDPECQDFFGPDTPVGRRKEPDPQVGRRAVLNDASSNAGSQIPDYIVSRRDFVVSQVEKRQQTPIVMAKPFDPNDKPFILASDNFGTITCEALTGGIVGQSWLGDITMCNNYGSICGVNRMWGGGIAGYVGTDPRLTGDDACSVAWCVNYADINKDQFNKDAGLAGMWEGVYIGGIAGMVTDYFDEEGYHSYIDFRGNANRGGEVDGRFGVGGAIGYLVNGVDEEGDSRESHVYELVNTGNVNGSDCVGGVVGACPGVITDTVNYGCVELFPQDYYDYYFAGGLTGSLSSTGVCVSSYNIGKVKLAVENPENAGPIFFLGGVTGDAGNDQQVDGSYYCFETAPAAQAIVGSWFGDDNYGYVQLEDMGGEAADIGLIALFDRSASLHKQTQWDYMDNVEKDGKTYYMTPQFYWCEIGFDELYAAGQVYSYPVDISDAVVIMPTGYYDGKNMPPTIKVMLGGIEITPDHYDVVQPTEYIDAGDYPIEIHAKTGEGSHYTGTIKAVYTIEKAPQLIRGIKPTKKTIKKGKSFQLKTTVSQGDGAITYKKLSGNKNITVSASGKVKANKKVKKGKTYKIKVKVTVAETANYEGNEDTAIIKVKIK